MTKKKQLLMTELAKREKNSFYQKYPEKWMVDKFGYDAKTVYWGQWGKEYDEHKWDGDENPFLIACETLSGRVKGKKHVAIESGTSCGNTYFLPVLIYWFLDCFENSLVVTTAPTLTQLNTHLWSEMQRSFFRFTKLRPKAEIHGLTLFPDGKKSEEDCPSSHIYCCYGKASDDKPNVTNAIAGIHREHMLAVIDDGSAVSPNVFNSLMNTSTALRNHIIAVGKPSNQTDPLHTFSLMPNVNQIRISALDHPNIVLNKEVIPGAISKESIEMCKNDYGEDSRIYKARVQGISPKQHK